MVCGSSPEDWTGGNQAGNACTCVGRGPGGGGEQGYGINTDAREPGVPSNCDELRRPPRKMTEKGWGRKAWEVGRGRILPREFLLLILSPREENLALQVLSKPFRTASSPRMTFQGRTWVCKLAIVYYSLTTWPSLWRGRLFSHFTRKESKCTRPALHSSEGTHRGLDRVCLLPKSVLSHQTRCLSFKGLRI